MKSKHMSALLREDITTVSVYIQRDVVERDGPSGIRRYTFKVLRDDAAKMKVDDVLVVDTKNGMTIATVQEIHADPQIDPDFDGDYRWVVQTVDMARFKAVIEHEREMDKVMLNVEREVKRKTIVEQYRETLGKSAIGTRFATLLKGPVIEAPAAAPRKAAKR